ncbi:MAG: hypothetical protein LUC31_02405 [Coprobacillus sp.]|nr:hypothetical protein [Coprobacillus sp.]
MRKSSIFILIVALLVSVVVITFFGKAIEMSQFKVYMESITITNVEPTILGGREFKMMNFYFDYSKEFNSFFVEYEWTPDDATEPGSVMFYLTGDTYTDSETGEVTTYAQISANGELLFWQPAVVTVYVVTTDGSQLSDSMMVVCTALE